MKTMEKIAASAVMLLTSLGVSSCDFANASHSAEVVGGLKYTQDDLREKPFKAIDVNVVSDVYYTQNDGNECKVKIDYSAVKDEKLVQKLKENLKVVYRDDEVIIGFKGHMKFPGNSPEGQRLKIYITSPDLVKVTQEGVGAFHAKSINSDRFAIDNEGVGSVYIDKILANKVDVDNEGVGSVKVGSVKGDNVKISNEGVGSVNVDKVDAAGFDVDNDGIGSVGVGFYKGGNMKITNDGVGKVSAQVDCKSLNVVLDGVGGVNVSGTTLKYNRHRDGVGGINDGGLKIGK